MKKSNALYTTVTTSDFNDHKYINQLIELNIGLELAFLTKLSSEVNLEKQNKDLDVLKKEMTDFCRFFDKFKIQPNNIRIHQPGGYMYYWSSSNQASGFEPLKSLFTFCYNLGFQDYVIHAPYGNSSVNQNLELSEYREKLSTLVPNANLEVEEILASNKELKKQSNARFYSDKLFEELMKRQQATILLDAYECGGIDKTIARVKDLTSKGFLIKTIHLHKNKHQFLTSNEIEQLLKSKPCGNFVNEGFIKTSSSFDEFIKIKSAGCVVPNNQRIEILESYKEKMSV